MMIHGITDWFFPRAHPRRQKVSSQGLLCGLCWPFAASTLLRFGVEIVRGVPASPFLRPGGLIFARLRVAAVLGLIYSIRGRIRPVGSHIREQKGASF